MRILLFCVSFSAAGVMLGLGITWLELRGGTAADFGPEAPGPPVQPEGSPQPRLEIDHETHHFGKMARGTSGRHEFVFHNAGEHDLRLEQGATSCKCTISNVANGRIPPGDSAAVRLDWDAITPGETFRQTAVIWTNDRRRRRVILTVQGELTQPLVAEPSHVALGDVTAGTSKSATVELYSYTQPPATEVFVGFDRPESGGQFEVTQQPLAREDFSRPDAAGGFLLQVTAKSGLPLGTIDQTILVSTDVATAGNLRIPLSGRVVSEFRVGGRGWNKQQHTLSLGTIENTADAEGRLEISYGGDQPQRVELTVEKSYPPFLDVRLEGPLDGTSGKSRRWVLKLRIPAGQAPGNYTGVRGMPPGEMILRTTHPGVPRLPMTVKFIVASGDD